MFPKKGAVQKPAGTTKTVSGPIGKKIPAGVAPVVTSGKYDPDMDGDNDALVPSEKGEKFKGAPMGKKGIAGSNPQGPNEATPEQAPAGAAPGTEISDPMVNKIKSYNKGKRSGRQVKDPFKMADTIHRLKKGRG